MKVVTTRIALAFWLSLLSGVSQELHISGLDHTGVLRWSGAYTAGVMTVQTRPDWSTDWQFERNLFTSNTTGEVQLPLTRTQAFVRLLAVDISAQSPAHFTNLIQSYGRLETLAGKGEYSQDKRNNWLPEYEGGPATNANLSRPHTVFADPQNNLLVVDEGSGSVLKITPQGTIHTYAGTHTNGFNGDGPAPATTLHLYYPNGGWMRADGTFYVLDTYNGRIRRIDTNGIMTTLVIGPGPFSGGRALWVKSDESEIYFGEGTVLRKWTPETGITTVRSGFADLGNILGDEATGDLYIADRNAHSVYRLTAQGDLIRIAGNGTTFGGGDGFPATQTGLNRPRTIAFFPNGGFLIGEHHPGNRIWYVDPAGIIHLWMNGARGVTRPVGDGEWFYKDPLTPKVYKVRFINFDRLGNIIMVDNDYGYIRRIRFERLFP